MAKRVPSLQGKSEANDSRTYQYYGNVGIKIGKRQRELTKGNAKILD